MNSIIDSSTAEKKKEKKTTTTKETKNKKQNNNNRLLWWHHEFHSYIPLKLLFTIFVHERKKREKGRKRSERKEKKGEKKRIRETAKERNGLYSKGRKRFWGRETEGTRQERTWGRKKDLEETPPFFFSFFSSVLLKKVKRRFFPGVEHTVGLCQGSIWNWDGYGDGYFLLLIWLILIKKLPLRALVCSLICLPNCLAVTHELWMK